MTEATLLTWLAVTSSSSDVSRFARLCLSVRCWSMIEWNLSPRWKVFWVISSKAARPIWATIRSSQACRMALCLAGIVSCKNICECSKFREWIWQMTDPDTTLRIFVTLGMAFEWPSFRLWRIVPTTSEAASSVERIGLNLLTIGWTSGLMAGGSSDGCCEVSKRSSGKVT